MVEGFVLDDSDDRPLDCYVNEFLYESACMLQTQKILLTP